ncbi:DUF1801 domain-containing protein [Paramicrobacterium chengjingii]|uniref:DUF1801 domain-containing protein n=1 Tax=Paramicrobacterium chengjingii TaxID=2769067 RepID=A0ABX6YJI5_9MICO|nr:DUF1801 domain-containing protein [Microbacterium chengjingii]QPZ38916.1 DUF1801 domain-containing protein [Microbacterium chengjingii]
MSTKNSGTGGFSDEERAAIKARASELKNESSRGKRNKKASEELDLLDKIQSMSDSDRVVAERLHAIVTATAPELSPKLWYGQPAYARDGKVVCFFRSGDTDKQRYSTFGFSPEAALDDSSGLWPTSYAVTELTAAAEKTIVALVKKAMA